ncbi:hypothetical protein EJB05_39202, partial [Eragrostis curvula]
MAAADRLLSALPDSVLRRVISFLPVGDAAGTSALSGRWRALWLQADAVNLDTRLFLEFLSIHMNAQDPTQLHQCHWDDDSDGRVAGRLLFRDAMAAVTAAGRRPVRKLTVRVSSTTNGMDYCEKAMREPPGLDAVLAAPATRRLEELRLGLYADFDCTCGYELPTRRLPCAASLRVLKLTGCALGPPTPLASCHSPLANLQAVLDAAPNLATLFLENFSFTAEEELGRDWYAVMRKRRFLLRCPASLAAVTLLHYHGTDGLDLDAPGDRFLRYKGYLEHFPFTSAATPPSGMPVNLQHAELRFCRRCCNPPSMKARPHAKFWESIGSFGHLRFLKLKLLDINDIAVHPEQEATLLKEFPDLKFLELKGSYENDKRGAAVAIANFLRCCLALQELRLKLKIHGDLYASPKGIRLSEGREAQLDLEKSTELLKRLKSKMGTAECNGVDDDDRLCNDVDLSALQASSFPCLESHLWKIRLKFDLEDFNCFEVKIAKFLVENAVMLEEMQVRDGDQRVHDHIHRKLALWRANSSNSKIDIVGEKVKTRRRWWET